MPYHGGDQTNVKEPSYAKESSGEKPEKTRARAVEVKPVDAEQSKEEPQQISATDVLVSHQEISNIFVLIINDLNAFFLTFYFWNFRYLKK